MPHHGAAENNDPCTLCLQHQNTSYANAALKLANHVRCEAGTSKEETLHAGFHFAILLSSLRLPCCICGHLAKRLQVLHEAEPGINITESAYNS